MDVRAAHVKLYSKPWKVAEIGPKTRFGRWLSAPWVVLEQPGGKKTPRLYVSDSLSIDVAFDFDEKTDGDYSFRGSC